MFKAMASSTPVVPSNKTPVAELEYPKHSLEGPLHLLSSRVEKVNWSRVDLEAVGTKRVNKPLTASTDGEVDAADDGRPVNASSVTRASNALRAMRKAIVAQANPNFNSNCLCDAHSVIHICSRAGPLECNCDTGGTPVIIRGEILLARASNKTNCSRLLRYCLADQWKVLGTRSNGR
jgi:hypothetical protein